MITQTEMQELYCHNCGGYVQFPIDTSLNGNHVVTCPNCGHEHCRVIDNGKITDFRWGQRNPSLPTFAVNRATTTYTTVAVSDTSTAGSFYTMSAWLNTTTGSS